MSNLSHGLTPRFSGMVGYNFTYIDLRSGHGDNSTTHNPTLGFAYRPTPTLTVSIDGGPAFTKLGDEDFITPGVSAGIVQRLPFGSASVFYRRPAVRAEMRAIAQEIRAEVLLAEALRACRAFGHRVAEAVLEEERALFVAQVARSSAMDVGYSIAVERDRVVRRDRPPAAWTRRLSHVRWPVRYADGP